jgi:hypothetical protein
MYPLGGAVRPQLQHFNWVAKIEMKDFVGCHAMQFGKCTGFE